MEDLKLPNESAVGIQVSRKRYFGDLPFKEKLPYRMAAMKEKLPMLFVMLVLYCLAIYSFATLPHVNPYLKTECPQLQHVSAYSSEGSTAVYLNMEEVRSCMVKNKIASEFSNWKEICTIFLILNFAFILLMGYSYFAEFVDGTRFLFYEALAVNFFFSLAVISIRIFYWKMTGMVI